MQSRFVAQRILELREEGIELDEIAVLFRSSFHSFDLELELQRRDIPFIKRGGFKFIETAHIKDVLAHLRVIANPVDAVSWLRVLLLVKGIGHRKAERLIERWSRPATRPRHWRSREKRRRSGGRADAARRAAGGFAGGENAGGADSDGAGILSAADARGVSRRLPQARARPGALPDHHGTLRSLEQMLADMALEPPNDSLGDVLAVDSEEGS